VATGEIPSGGKHRIVVRVGVSGTVVADAFESGGDSPVSTVRHALA